MNELDLNQWVIGYMRGYAGTVQLRNTKISRLLKQLIMRHN